MPRSIVLLAACALAAASPADADDPPTATAPAVKNIAAICTAYQPIWHADAIVTKFLAGFPTDEGLLAPKVRIASMYIDQGTPDDLGHKLAELYGVPVYDTVAGALTLGGDRLAVDGVLLIGEHGKYPKNRFGQTMYPRLLLAAQVFRVLEASGRSVPVFLDKHLSYNWSNSKWIYDRARELEVPMMAGSSVPLVWRSPALEHPRGAKIDEAVCLTYADPDSYGVHGFEVVQSMVERRSGGETGVASVRCVRGKAFYEAAEAGEFSMDLVEAAAAALGDRKKPGAMRDHARDPIAMIVRYRDGLRATVVFTHEYYGMWWAYAARADGKTVATEFVFPRLDTIPAFSYLGLNIQEMFLTCRPQYPVERTLLASGVVDAACRSLTGKGQTVETPHLDIRYEPYDFEPIRPKAAAPAGACLMEWPPQRVRELWPKEGWWNRTKR